MKGMTIMHVGSETRSVGLTDILALSRQHAGLTTPLDWLAYYRDHGHAPYSIRGGDGSE